MLSPRNSPRKSVAVCAAANAVSRSGCQNNPNAAGRNAARREVNVASRLSRGKRNAVNSPNRLPHSARANSADTNAFGVPRHSSQ